MELALDPNRLDYPNTGIYVRAKDGDRWITADLSRLDAPSLLKWLRGRGGDNPRAEDVVGILLGHGNLHSRED